MTRLLAVFLVLGLLAPPVARAYGERVLPGPIAQFQGATKNGEVPRGGRGFRGARESGPPRQEPPRQRERMTEEERRDLHRDLDRANREIYRPRPSR